MSENEQSILTQSEQSENIIDNTEEINDSKEFKKSNPSKADNPKETNIQKSSETDNTFPKEKNITIKINNNNNQTLTNKNSSTSNNKQISVYTKMSEKLMKNLHTSGAFQFNLCYDNLLNENLITSTISSQNQKPLKSKVILNFLERNVSYNVRNVLPSSINNQKVLVQVNISPREKEKKAIKEKIRTPEKYHNDQIEFVEEKEKKIECQRKKLETKTSLLYSSKPKINNRSKTIANQIKRNKNVHERLFMELPKRKKELIVNNMKKNMKKKNKNNNNNNNNKVEQKYLKKSSGPLTNKQIDDCFNKLYLEGVEKTKKRCKSNNNYYIDKVNNFDSNEYKIYNNKKDLIELGVKQRQSFSQSINIGNTAIIINALFKEVDTISTQENFQNSINYLRFCMLLFKLGFLQYNHEKILSSISNNNNNIITIEYKDNESKAIEYIEKITKEEEITLLYPFSSKISFDHLNKEQTLISKAFKSIKNNFDINDNISFNQNNDTTTLPQIKLFLLIILGLYTGYANDEKKDRLFINQINTQSKNSKLLTKTKSDNLLFKYYSPQNKVESANSLVLRNLKFSNGVPFSKCKKLKNAFTYFKSNRSLFEEYKREIKREEKLNAYPLNQELTFKPKIRKSKGESLKLEENYCVLQQRHMSDIEKMQREKSLKEMKDCTFIPNNKKVDPAKSTEISERLYNVCKKKKNDNIVSSNNNIDKECTFTPLINQKLNEQIFAFNPIKDDSLLNAKMEKYEKARIEKQLMNFIYFQGGNLVTKVRKSDEWLKELQNEQNIENFKFGLERRTNKDTFDKFAKESKGDKNCNRKRIPLFTIEVKIKDKIELLDYYKNDDPVKITKMFCKRHNLGESSKVKILAVIEDRLKINEQTESNLS